jgi:hypothetical protein
MTTNPENFLRLEQARVWPHKNFNPRISLGNSGTVNLIEDTVWQFSGQNHQKGPRVITF